MVFLPNFNVTNGQRIYPAADLSEQISTAGKEASGTGNMKFQMNGALTIGTLDGANIEIREEVGAENFFLFGITRRRGAAGCAPSGYRPMDLVQRDAGAARGHRADQQRVLLARQQRAVPAAGRQPHAARSVTWCWPTYRAYADCQQQVDAAFGDTERWTRMSILNTAHAGKFSSDRTISEYCREIWRATPVPIRLQTPEQVQSGLLQ